MMEDIVGYYRCHNFQVSAQLPIQIGRGAGQFAQEFFDHIPQEIRNSFNLNLEKVIKNRRYREAAACFRRGRIKLIRKEWANARKDFIKTLSIGSLLTRLKAIVGLLTGCLKIILK